MLNNLVCRMLVINRAVYNYLLTLAEQAVISIINKTIIDGKISISIDLTTSHLFVACLDVNGIENQLMTVRGARINLHTLIRRRISHKKLLSATPTKKTISNIKLSDKQS